MTQIGERLWELDAPFEIWTLVGRGIIRPWEFVMLHHSWKPDAAGQLRIRWAMRRLAFYLADPGLHRRAHQGFRSEHFSAAIDGYHKYGDSTRKGWQYGFGYHFAVEPDGTLVASLRWKEQLDGAHCHEHLMNRRALGLCLIGDFDRFFPTPEQWATTVSLLCELDCGFRTFGIPLERPRIRLHRDDAPYKSCPGERVTGGVVEWLVGEARKQLAAYV